MIGESSINESRRPSAGVFTHKDYALKPSWRLESIQEWSDYMKTPSTWNFRPIAGKVMMGLVLAVMAGSIGVVQSFGEDGHDRGNRYERGRNEQRGRGYARGHYKQVRRYDRQPVYQERVYVAPPPVVYAPPEPVGLSIFLPPIIFRP